MINVRIDCIDIKGWPPKESAHHNWSRVELFVFTKPAEDRFLLLFRCIIHGPKRHGLWGAVYEKVLQGPERSQEIYIYDIYVIKYTIIYIIYIEQSNSIRCSYYISTTTGTHYTFDWNQIWVWSDFSLSLSTIACWKFISRFEYVQQRFHEDAPDPSRRGFKRPETVLSLYSVTCWFFFNGRFEILPACKFLAAGGVVYIGRGLSLM